MNEIYRRGMLCLLALGIYSGAFAQDSTTQKWSLEQCIQHSLDHNTDLKKQNLAIEVADNNLETNKLSALPSLSAGINNTTSWGRTLGNENTYVDRNSNSTGFNVNANVRLYQGGALKNQTKAAKLDVAYQKEMLEVNQSNLTIQVTQAYLNILVSQELLDLTKEQTAITRKQLEITRAKVEAGSIDKGPLLELEAQLANNISEEVTNQNNFELATLRLAQMLELEDPSVLQIQNPELATVRAQMQLNGAEMYYQSALTLRPEIKAANTMIERGNASAKAAKGGLYPTISAGANYSNGYYHYSGTDNASFQDQMKGNARQSVNVNLSIPIFNGKRAKNSYKNAKIQVMQSKIDMIKAEKQLRSDVTTALTQAKGAQQKYQSATVQVKTSKESFDFSQEKFNEGAMDVYNYNQAKNSFIRAKSQKIQAKYEFIFKTKVLDFYIGKEIKL
ncbi:TolC family protein [Halosquirtibacter laminarini]|uniref:TolC family protein n=1 Tax=Halosquirtibacter laminarini TaxID=3374600 RepID=A0AC61NDV2_9BACT|nr:TolC family protein [Prolixibacteraceae bacterium]